MKIYDFYIASFRWILFEKHGTWPAYKSLRKVAQVVWQCDSLRLAKYFNHEKLFCRKLFIPRENNFWQQHNVALFPLEVYLSDDYSVNAVNESRKKYANFVIFWSQFLGSINPCRRSLMKVLWGLIIKQEELYFRLKSKSCLINNQELTPFSLDNLKIVFHTVRGFFNSHHIF